MDGLGACTFGEANLSRRCLWPTYFLRSAIRVEALRYRAYLYDEMGRGGAARDDFNKILELDPSNKDAPKALKRMGPDVRNMRMQ
jgi:hypothetical protein